MSAGVTGKAGDSQPVLIVYLRLEPRLPCLRSRLFLDLPIPHRHQPMPEESW
jgi:hypothetical protein